ncbi:type IX secretion system membrane protein PorP/SprF [Parapedobacter sp. SGR-10]|uniref:PorP/SprF family type IX secretion system membrane protein n=1 Tax=Parapedobacter sp. SGR-10 TaxID=2710879 RepID=UPI0013D12F95|nr:PorP/SprF family type IX secretion system membrane protein [Parapedobacter sp. SGR-10]NGF57730.1 type IX secretion system membrane protein PorP/SprF [Parapedobacter sp. SGR-10]
MKKHITLIIVGILLSLPYVGKGQHGLSYNQFGQFRNSFNGSLSMMDPQGGAAVLSRLQWIGMDGAPRAYWASGHVGVKSLGITIGVDVKQVRLGATRDSEVGGYIASKVRLSKDEYLGLSVGGGLLFHKSDFFDLDMTDPAFRDDVRNFQGMMSLGTSYFKEDKWYIGFSIPRLVLDKQRQQEDYDFRQVYYATGGILFQVNEGFHIKPSLMLSHMEGIETRFDVNALAFFAQRFGVGMGVQNQGDLSGLLQFNIKDFGIGYSYQFNVSSRSANQRITNSTHEIGLRYRVGGMKML